MLKRFKARFLRSKKPVSILVVCMENLCRSPMAEGFIRQALEAEGLGNHVEVASAGVLVSMPGSRPDPRAITVSIGHGVDISGIRARKIRAEDFQYYDLIFAVDENVSKELMLVCPKGLSSKVEMLIPSINIADPYYGNLQGFEVVAGLLLERAAWLSKNFTFRFL